MAAPATVFLIGAGGCGMSGLGHLLLDLGHAVAGSDLSENQQVRELRARGAQIHVGHSAEHLHAARPILVVYSSAVGRHNPELLAAERRRIPIVRRATLLAALMQRQHGVCVAGMHGKTTTAALLAFALQQLQARPSFAIGSAVRQLGRCAHFSTAVEPTSLPSVRVMPDELATFSGAKEFPNGAATLQNSAAEASPLFVAETDESDGTLCAFQPEHAIILNIDEEHLDYYANFAAICEEFQRFGAQTRGWLVYCADDPHLVRLYAGRPQTISFGFNPLSTYRIEMPPAAEDRFEIWRGETCLGEFSLRLMGEKNLSNAAGVIAFLHQLGYAPAAIAESIKEFSGAARRQQELFRNAQYRVFDDYGHHPEEIKATLRALLSLKPNRLLVAFQPHRFTRTRALFEAFTTCFQPADKLWLTEVYAASEPPIPGVNGAVLAKAIEAREQPVEFVPTIADLSRTIRAAMQPGDLVLFLGAGDITRAAHELAAQLKATMNASTEDFYQRLAAQLSPATVCRRDEPLAKRTTLRVGGTADCYVEPASETELAAVIRACVAEQVPYAVLGRGSNLLIRDGGIRGVVISLAHPHFSRVEVDGARLHCGAGAKLKTVALEARNHGLGGLEFLEGIPGSVGGALRMNAGAMGAQTFERVETIRFMDAAGNIHERNATGLAVEYRNCPLLKTHIALGAVFHGQPAARETIEQRLAEGSRKRWQSQPKESSAGCMFKNPLTIPAGKLVDELGLKGTRIGGARVSEVHGNFIVNDGAATAKDVLQLIALIRARAKSERGIDLEIEVEIIGEETAEQ